MEVLKTVMQLSPSYIVVVCIHAEESVSWASHKHSTGVITQISYSKQLGKEREEYHYCYRRLVLALHVLQ